MTTHGTANLVLGTVESVLPARRRGLGLISRAELIAVHPLGPGFLVEVSSDVGRLVVPMMAGADGVLRRAVAGDGMSAAVLRSASLEQLGPLPAETGEHGIAVDQTNESVVVGGAVVVKWMLVAESEPTASTRAARRLAAAGFAPTPAPIGLLHLDDRLVATVHAHVPDAVDGWDWLVADLVAWVAGDGPDPIGAATHLGALAADLHLVLSTPVAADEAWTSAWHAHARQQLAEAIAVTDGDAGTRLRDWSPAIERALDQVLTIAGIAVAPIHGDLHVGQFLRSVRGMWIVDFDGDPLSASTSRLELAPPAVDVASLLRSIDHAGRIADRRTDRRHTATIEDWLARARMGALEAYTGRCDLLDERLLGALEVAQECHEYVYAARYLPHWVYVPDAALPVLMKDSVDGRRD
ncbi:MAG TPA: hypothetical protein VGM78_11440 [Ilumatobacteraceae bacterium]